MTIQRQFRYTGRADRLRIALAVQIALDQAIEHLQAGRFFQAHSRIRDAAKMMPGLTRQKGGADD